ncbi:lycopene cyclase family protein [Halovibrio variabilis]|uniref:lycopene cyclase family protein n=1 Tax=Halovibrio variabilis TaxID=31910 RepID=UPI00147837A2|nr:lycopene cyclase family protein [Halovibrio variabilis]
MPPDTDVAILGAGLAGLSIASWLIDVIPPHASAPRVHLLEARQADTNDRTWCFWDQQPHPFRKAISHRWPRWQVRFGNQCVEREDAEHCYSLLSASAMRRSAYAAMATRPEFDFTRGVDVGTISPQDDGLHIATSQGGLTSKLVIDTRPPQAAMLSSHEGVWQVFHGVEVHCPDHGVSPSTACLMDFQTGFSGVNFVYLLPLDDHRLLAEWTCFHVDKTHPDCQRLLTQQVPPQLSDWLNKRLGTQWTLSRQETGCLPMMPVVAPQLNPRYLAAGIRGGWMRPATGYMFASCQRGAADVARQIQRASQTGRWELTPPRLRSSALEWMDKVFLQALRQSPEQAPGWFMQLFERTRAIEQRRFLGDEPRLSDLLAIMRGLPAGPFLKAAIRLARHS